MHDDKTHATCDETNVDALMGGCTENGGQPCAVKETNMDEEKKIKKQTNTLKKKNRNVCKS